MNDVPEGQTTLEDFEELLEDYETLEALRKAFQEASEALSLESTLNDVLLRNVEEQLKLAKEILESPPKTIETLRTFAQKQYRLNQRSLQFVEFFPDE